MSAPGTDGPATFDSAELLARLAEVDAELPDGEHIQIAVIGGAAILFLRPGRFTNDGDVISEGMPQILREVAARVAARYGLRSDWINDAAKIGLPHLDPELETIYRGKRLTVGWQNHSQRLPSMNAPVCARRSHMCPRWLIETRVSAAEAGLEAQWQQVVDALTVAGRSQLAPYSV